MIKNLLGFGSVGQYGVKIAHQKSVEKVLGHLIYHEFNEICFTAVADTLIFAGGGG